MIETVKELIIKHKAFILYGIFGVLTTIVNVVSYYLCARMLALNTVVSTVIAWLLAVIFAYLTNRKWVFESKENTTKGIIREIVAFFSCRIATGVLDVVIMFVFVDMMMWNDVLIKFASNVLVILLNYVASKLIIFKNN